MRFIFIAFIFYIAAYIIEKYDLVNADVYTGVYVMFVGAIGSGVSMSQAPSISKA